MTAERDDPDGLDEAVKARRERQELLRREGERSIAQNLAMIGALGWLIVIPTLLGIFVGRLLDHAFGLRIVWTLALLIVGLVFGCVLAWKRMYSE